MSDWNFGKPSSGGGDQFKAADNIGRLVAFVEPERKNVTTRYGEQDATACTHIVVLDGSDAGLVYDDPLLFGNISRDAYGDGDAKIVLGRVGIGPAKPGQSPPYILEPATDADQAVAKAWFDANAAVTASGRIKINEPAPF